LSSCSQGGGTLVQQNSEQRREASVFRLKNSVAALLWPSQNDTAWIRWPR